MKVSSKQGDPKEMDRWEEELKANGYIRMDTTNPKKLKRGQYLRREFTGTGESFDGPSQSEIECRLK